MVNTRFDAEPLQQLDAAHAQQDLLLNPGARVGAVQP